MVKLRPFELGCLDTQWPRIQKNSLLMLKDSEAVNSASLFDGHNVIKLIFNWNGC